MPSVLLGRWYWVYVQAIDFLSSYPVNQLKSTRLARLSIAKAAYLEGRSTVLGRGLVCISEMICWWESPFDLMIRSRYRRSEHGFFSRDITVQISHICREPGLIPRLAVIASRRQPCAPCVILSVDFQVPLRSWVSVESEDSDSISTIEDGGSSSCVDGFQSAREAHYRGIGARDTHCRRLFVVLGSRQ